MLTLTSECLYEPMLVLVAFDAFTSDVLMTGMPSLVEIRVGKNILGGTYYIFLQTLRKHQLHNKILWLKYNFVNGMQLVKIFLNKLKTYNQTVAVIFNNKKTLPIIF